MKARSATRLRLDDLTLLELMALQLSFRPTGRPAYDLRWGTWSAYLRDWELVRGEALACAAAGDPAWTGELFAEEARRHAAIHGVEALDQWCV